MLKISNSFVSQTILLTLITLLGLGQNAFAENRGAFFGKEAGGKWIIGAKAAKLDNNQQDVKDADAVGIVLGYEFDRPIGNNGGKSTFELEYITGDSTPITGVGKYEANVLNAFITYRSAGTLYYKLKVGLSYTDLLLTTPAFDNTFEDVALAAGIGLGYHISDIGAVEIEYSQGSGDSDLGVLGLNALLEF